MKRATLRNQNIIVLSCPLGPRFFRASVRECFIEHIEPCHPETQRVVQWRTKSYSGDKNIFEPLEKFNILERKFGGKMM